MNRADTSSGQQPYLVVVDDEESARSKTAGVLERRYVPDYRIAEFASAESALAELGRLSCNGEEVAVVLADQWMPGLTGTEVLSQVNNLFPFARRGLLVNWGAWADEPTTDAILEAMSLGHIDYYVLKPLHESDEFFHRTIAEFLHEWSRSGHATSREVVVVAARSSQRGQELRSLLHRNGVPYSSLPSDSPEGRRLLAEAGESDDRSLVRMLDGRFLVDPTNAELARAYGVRTVLGEMRDFEVVIVGAGPAGLAAAVYASSEGLTTLVVEQEAIGGQAGTSSLIRNYLGFSRGVRGAELAQRAYQQAWVFGTRFLHMQSVTALERDDDRYRAELSEGSSVTGRAVVLANGVTYRRTGLPAVERLTGAGVFYGASLSEAQALSGEDAYIVGGGNSAGQAALHLSRHARRVTLLVRGEALAEGMSQYLREQIDAAPKVEVRLRTEVVEAGGPGRLEWLDFLDRSGGTRERVETRGLFIMIGARPRTDWLGSKVARDRWGYVVTGVGLDPHAPAGSDWPLERPPRAFETSLPGVFAVGDVRHRSVKRVASAVGEGSVVVQQIHEHLMTDSINARLER